MEQSFKPRLKLIRDAKGDPTYTRTRVLDASGRPLRDNRGGYVYKWSDDPTYGFLHPCCICGSLNAPFGFGTKLLKGKPGDWYCVTHKPASGDEACQDTKPTISGGDIGFPISRDATA